MACPGGHMFYIGLYRENVKKNLFVWNHKAKSLDIWYVASPSGPSMFVRILVLGPKMVLPWGSIVLHRLI